MLNFFPATYKAVESMTKLLWYQRMGKRNFATVKLFRALNRKKSFIKNVSVS